MIAHVDIDAFFASVEQVRDPRLRSQPVAVGNGVVASCSYEARARGCRTAMTLTDARRVCPEIVILDGDAATYRCFAEAVFDICRRWSPQLETYLDEAVIDLSGTERLWGDALRVARGVRREVRRATGLAVTVGLGSNRMMARLATARAKPDGEGMLKPGCEAAFLAPLPIEQLPGVGAKTAQRLRELNVTTAGALRRLSRTDLEALFGVRGALLWERCRGHDGRVIAAREVPQSISRETSLHEPTTELAELRAMLRYLVERAARTARELGLAARTVTAKVRWVDVGGASARHSFAHGVATDETLFREARRLLERTLRTRRAAVHGAGVALSGFVPADSQPLDLFREAEKGRERALCAGLDQIRDRYGHAAVVAGASIDLLGSLAQDRRGFVLRTPSLTR